MKRLRNLLPALFIIMLLLFAIPASADPGADSLRITDQPARLILQLGSGMAGAQFALRTDAGVYPKPLQVNASGVLQMELGGSKTYTLRLLQASAQTTEAPADDVDLDGFLAGLTEPGSENATAPVQQPSGESSVPTKHIVLLGAGILAAIGALIVLSGLKKRRAPAGDDEDYDEYF